jgi:DNA-binding CsgD family transcriptional regulator
MEEANKISAALGDDELARVAPVLLAELERFEGHHAVARPLYAMVRQIAVKTGDLMGQMICLNNMGWTAVALNDHSAALECAEASLAIADQLDSRRGRWIVMEVCASVAADIGEHDTAARLDAAALVHTTQMGRYRDKADAALLDARIEIARTALGARAYNAAVDAGRALSQEDAIAEMRAWLAAHPPEGFVTGGTRHPTMNGAEPSAGIEGADSLTPREREVISLVARGYSNADIATLMEISVFTVRTHRQRLMQKLDLRNAAEITALAVQLGLYSPN